MRTKKKYYGPEDFIKKYGPLTLANFLSSWRLCDEMSQRDFAKKLGISPANLCDIEKGRKGVSLGKAVEIAEIIGYSPTVMVKLALQELVNASGLDLTVEVRERAA